VLLPGIFVVLVTWIGGHFVLSGRIDVGDLVAFYGYAAFLVIPLRTAAEAVDKVTRALVGARRMVDVLGVERVVEAPADPLAEPPANARLVDDAAGLTIEPGLVTALVSRVPDETAALAARLGRIAPDGEVRLGGTSLARLSLDVVRRRIVVSEQDPVLFSGDLRRQLDPWARADDETILAALDVANAHHVLDALPEGLDAEVDERARSFSGGQRQRLALARALLADAETLVLVEPTSAVDAHTEAWIALAPHRAHGTDDGDRDDEPAGARPGRQGRARGRRRRLGRRNAPRAAPHEPRLPRHRHPPRGRLMATLLPIADGPELRGHARRIARRHRAPLPESSRSTGWPRPPGSSALRCSAVSSSRSSGGRRPRTSTGSQPCSPGSSSCRPR
jgi:ABC-type iron transport system FetAB ATPase subunit